MHYYSHHIGDYRSNTAHLSNEEDLAYRRLLEMYYDTEQPIPLETQWVARRLRVAVEALQSVLEDFFLLTDGGWTHQRCDRELRQYHIVQERNKANGSKGGRPKSKNDDKNNPLGSQSVASRLPVETDRKGNQEPITINQEPETKNQEPRTRERKESDDSSQVAIAPRSKLARPEEVQESTWADWIALRKQKKAAVTQTVIDAARREAVKAGMTLEEFLRIWCFRGSQGLQADWIKPSERQQSQAASLDEVRKLLGFDNGDVFDA